MQVSIIREPDDKIADVRISIGKPKNMDGLYIVFRGNPKDTVKALEQALLIAQKALPRAAYKDRRGRPQG